LESSDIAEYFSSFNMSPLRQALAELMLSFLIALPEVSEENVQKVLDIVDEQKKTNTSLARASHQPGTIPPSPYFTNIGLPPLGNHIQSLSPYFELPPLQSLYSQQLKHISSLTTRPSRNAPFISYRLPRSYSRLTATQPFSQISQHNSSVRVQSSPIIDHYPSVPQHSDIDDESIFHTADDANQALWIYQRYIFDVKDLPQ
jgi:hypothetical protein